MATVIEAATTDVPLPDRYEVINGEIVEVPPVSGFSGEVANRVRDELTVYAHTSRRGRARNDMLFRVPLRKDRGRNREPDAAFITFERWPADRPLPYRGNTVDVVPNLMVEVVSPTDDAEALLAKAHEYLRAGAELVWLVYPRVRQIYAYSDTRRPPQVFTETDTLDGGDVLPGFTAAVADLFPPVTGLPEPTDDE